MRLEIIVSLRTAASAEAPSSPILLHPRLRARSGMGMVREEACQRALTQKRTLGVAAHLRLEIIVSLRMAASSEAPSAPISFPPKL